MIVVPGSRLALFEIQYMDYARYNWYNFGLALGLGVFIYIEQKFIVEPIFYWLKNKYPKKEWIWFVKCLYQINLTLSYHLYEII